jgi:hypothetical protein
LSPWIGSAASLSSTGCGSADWQDLASGTDAAAYSEALTWLDDRPVPCLSPAIAAVDAEVVEMEGGV